MEPVEFDRIIQNKLSEGNDLHEREMEKAKPFIWAAIQNKIGRKRSLTWIHLAAAVTLLMISFTFVIYRIQNGHQSEINALSNKIDQLQGSYLTQEDLLGKKDSQVEALRDDLQHVELQLSNLQQKKPQKETIIYRTDTVYLKQVEYITTVSDPVKPDRILETVDLPEKTEITNVELNDTDGTIYPSYSYRSTKSETIKLKFGSFAEKKN